MFQNSSLVVLGLLLVAYGIVSFLLKRRQRALGLEASVLTRSAIRVGLLWVNGPVLPLLLAPLFIQLRFAPGLAAGWSLSLLVLGLALSWSWWSVNVSLWRRWAGRRGADLDELQFEGESSSLLWPKGHFFEQTEWDRLRAWARRRGGA